MSKQVQDISAKKIHQLRQELDSLKQDHKETQNNSVELKAANERISTMTAKHVDTIIEKIMLEDEVAQLRK